MMHLLTSSTYYDGMAANNGTKCVAQSPHISRNPTICRSYTLKQNFSYFSRMNLKVSITG